MNKEQTRVTLFLGRDKKTWEGKVLYYLNNHHPGKKEGASFAMELISVMCLPFAMRFFGASEAEKKEAAMYSVDFLLNYVCRIVREFGLTSVAIPGVIAEPSGARIQPIYSSIENASTKYSSNGNSKSSTSIEVVENDDIEEELQMVDEDEDGWNFSELESGFVPTSEKPN